MTPLPRTACPVCQESVPVRVNGDLRQHQRRTSRSKGGVNARLGECPGSGMPTDAIQHDDDGKPYAAVTFDYNFPFETLRVTHAPAATLIDVACFRRTANENPTLLCVTDDQVVIGDARGRRAVYHLGEDTGRTENGCALAAATFVEWLEVTA